MSRLEARVTIYDVMDQVQVTCFIKSMPDDPSGPVEWSRLVVETIPGRGTTDPHEWLRDALVAVLEAT